MSDWQVVEPAPWVQIQAGRSDHVHLDRLTRQGVRDDPY
jgi:hypothetical protein